MLELGSRAAQKSGNSNHTCQTWARPFGSWPLGSCPWQWAGQVLGREELDVSWTVWEAGPLWSQSPVWTPAWPLPETISNASAAPLHLELSLPCRSLSLLLQGCCLCSSRLCHHYYFLSVLLLMFLCFTSSACTTDSRQGMTTQPKPFNEPNAPASDMAAQESLLADSLPAYVAWRGVFGVITAICLDQSQLCLLVPRKGTSARTPRVSLFGQDGTDCRVT